MHACESEKDARVCANVADRRHRSPPRHGRHGRPNQTNHANERACACSKRGKPAETDCVLQNTDTFEDYSSIYIPPGAPIRPGSRRSPLGTPRPRQQHTFPSSSHRHQSRKPSNIYTYICTYMYIYIFGRGNESKEGLVWQVSRDRLVKGATLTLARHNLQMAVRE